MQDAVWGICLIGAVAVGFFVLDPALFVILFLVGVSVAGSVLWVISQRSGNGKTPGAKLAVSPSRGKYAREGTIRGIPYNFEFTPHDNEDSGKLILCVRGPGVSNFRASRKGVRASFRAFVLRTVQISTGDRSFDEEVFIASARPTAAAAIFADPANRTAVRELLALGFDTLESDKAGVWAVREFSWTPSQFPIREILVNGVPSLGLLAGLKPQDTAESDSGAALPVQVERITQLVKRREPEIALFGFVPFVLPAIYWYIGGWTYALLSVGILIPFALVLNALPAPLIYVLGALVPAGIWKTYAACSVRNRIIDDGEVSLREFNSFPYAALAMADLLLGYIMALAAGWWFSFTMRHPLELEQFAFYLLTAPVLVWVTELVMGAILLRASKAAASRVNPYLAQQAARWEKKLYTPQGLRIETLLPTFREVFRAVCLPVAVAPCVVLASV